MYIRKYFLALLALFIYDSTVAQELIIDQSQLNLTIGQQATLSAKVVLDGKSVDRKIYYYSLNSRGVEINEDGLMKAHAPGETKIAVISPGDKRLRKDVTIKVAFPRITRVEIAAIDAKIYAGSTIPVKVKVYDALGSERTDVNVKVTTSNKTIAMIDPFHNLTAIKEGRTTLTARVDDIVGSVQIQIVENPVVSVDLSVDRREARTGDVFNLTAIAKDKRGRVVNDAPVTLAFVGKSYDQSSTASGLIEQEGRFVADEAGLYTITATSGNNASQLAVNVTSRDVGRKFEVVGSGLVSEKHTSDFWVWEGIDGRDYAVTGTWGADGTAYFWDVTNPANIVKVDSVQVDARTVNDVKISEDGRTCVISREGASNRKNGIVIIDVSNPSEVEIISTFTENLTGGVHNVFIYQNHVYALSNGEKYYVVNIEDRKKPYIVGKFELDTPGHAIHDVWIEDGIAYSSNWDDGVYLVDVGNGIAGGSPSNPVAFANYEYESGAHHATFPFKSPSTGKFYAVMGDEIFPYGLDTEGPMVADGFLHFVDFSDLDNPKEVARYQLPMAGSHNYWIDGETLYVAYYNGGVRVVDISGDLMGDLYKQGREIAWILPSDPNGYVPNAPFTWGAQLHKGHVFFSDWNSGLWSAKLEPTLPENPKIESR